MQVEGPAGVHRARAHEVAHGPLHGTRLAGERGLVQHHVVHEDAVHRHDLSGLDEEPVPGRHLLDGTHDQLAVLVARHGLGGALEQRRELAVRAAIRVRLEGVAAGQHQRDDGAGDVLAQRQRAGHGHERDEVHARLTADQAADDLARHRHDPDHGGDGPRDVRGVASIEEVEHTAGRQTHDGDAEQDAAQIHGLPGLLAHARTFLQLRSQMTRHGRLIHGHVDLIRQDITLHAIPAPERGDGVTGRRSCHLVARDVHGGAVDPSFADLGEAQWMGQGQLDRFGDPCPGAGTRARSGRERPRPGSSWTGDTGDSGRRRLRRSSPRRSGTTRSWGSPRRPHRATFPAGTEGARGRDAVRTMTRGPWLDATTGPDGSPLRRWCSGGATAKGQAAGVVRPREQRAESRVQRVQAQMQSRQACVGHAARPHGSATARGGSQGLERDLDVAVSHRQPLAGVLRGAPFASLQRVQVTYYVFVTRTVQTVPPLLAYSEGPMLCQRSRTSQVPLFSGTVLGHAHDQPVQRDAREGYGLAPPGGGAAGPGRDPRKPAVLPGRCLWRDVQRLGVGRAGQDPARVRPLRPSNSRSRSRTASS